MKCLIYSRVSTEDQAEKGRSIGDQIKMCKRYADDNGYRIIDIFKDEGKTATNMNRAGLQDLIIKCQEEKDIACVLVQDTDRLARNTSDHLQIKAILKKAGARVISISQPMLDDETPEGQFMDLVIAGVNAFQSKITGRKVSKCMKEKFLEGVWPSWVTVGYINDDIGTLEKPMNVISDDKFKQPLIKEAFRLFSKGIYSVEEVNDIVFKKGLTGRHGKKMSPSELNRVLKNPFYFGLMRWNGLEKMGTHTKIITKSLFDQCQNVFIERNMMANRERKHNFLLRGFVYCGTCGKRLTAEYHGSKFYYHCASKLHSNKGQNFDGDTTEARIEQLFDQLKLPDDFTKKVFSKAEEILKNSRVEVNQTKRTLNAQKAKLETKRDSIEDRLLEGVITSDVYVRQHNSVEEQIKNIEKQLDDANHNKNENIKVFEKLMFLSGNLGEAYRLANPRIKRHYLTIFWDRIEIKNHKIKKAVPTKTYLKLFPGMNYNKPENLVANHKIIKERNWRAEWDSNPRPIA